MSPIGRLPSSSADMAMRVQVRGRSAEELVQLGVDEAAKIIETWTSDVAWSLESITARPGEAGTWWGEILLAGRPI